MTDKDNLLYTQWKKEGRFDRRVDPRKWINPPGKNMLPIEERGVWGEHMAQKAKQKQQQKQQLNQKYQTGGKKSLLTSKSTRSKGGGGKGGTFGGIRGLKSPWQMIKRFLD